MNTELKKQTMDNLFELGLPSEVRETGDAGFNANRSVAKISVKDGHGEVKVGVSQVAKGRVKVQVVESGRVIEDRPWQDNLILNQGMNKLGANTMGNGGTARSNWCHLFLICCAGIGTRLTNNSSGATTGVYSGGVFTLTVDTYDFTDGLLAAGSLIKMTTGANSGVIMRITAVTDSTHVNVVFETGTAAASGTFNVYYAQQTGLETESARHSSYLTGAGNCESALTDNVLVHKRTYDFASPGSTLNYSELGFSDLTAAGANCNMRIKLSSPVQVTNVQQLRVVYQLSITLTPNTLTSKTANITNWTNTEGNEQWQLPGMSAVFPSSGGTTHFGNSSGTVMEPSETSTIGNGAGRIWVSTVATAPNASFVAPPNRADAITIPSRVYVLSTYTDFSFFRDKTCTFLVSEANVTGSTIRSMGIGLYDTSTTQYFPWTNATTFVFVFTTGQPKDSLHTLSLGFRFSWGRTL